MICCQGRMQILHVGHLYEMQMLVGSTPGVTVIVQSLLHILVEGLHLIS